MTTRKISKKEINYKMLKEKDAEFINQIGFNFLENKEDFRYIYFFFKKLKFSTNSTIS